MRIVVVGGSDAGISAALRAREIDSEISVDLIVADAFPNFSICGVPYFLSGEVSDWHTLAHRSKDEIERTGVQLHLEETATAIDAHARQIITKSQSGQRANYFYDRLIIGTGAVPIKPRIEGIDFPGVFVLHTIEECFALHRWLENSSVRSAVIVGGGYIGLEMADALRRRGLEVTLVEQLNAVMRTVDAPISLRVEALLREHGVVVRTQTTVTSITHDAGRLSVHFGETAHVEGDVVLMVAGVRPNSDLAKRTHLALNDRDAIVVDRAMRTNLPNIFAAGDCVLTWHSLLQRNTYMPLGTTAHKQGRVAGENAAGGDRIFKGSLGTQSVKLFNRVIAGSGLREADARSYGFEPLSTEITTYDHKAYYPGAEEMTVRIVGDVGTGRLLGAQVFGPLWQRGFEAHRYNRNGSSLPTRGRRAKRSRSQLHASPQLSVGSNSTRGSSMASCNNVESYLYLTLRD